MPDSGGVNDQGGRRSVGDRSEARLSGIKMTGRGGMRSVTDRGLGEDDEGRNCAQTVWIKSAR